MTAESLRVLVTGGTGLVGRSVVDRLICAGTPVRILSRSGQRAAHPMVTTLRGHIESAEDIRAAMTGCSAVIHCGGEKSDRAAMKSVNVLGTKLVFDLAAECGLKFFCHLSTVGVIGQTSLKIVDEAAACNPRNLYEETKLAAEQIVGNGIPGGRLVILRPTNVFGLETLPSLLNGAFRAKARTFLIGRENSHLVYVEDVAAAAIHCLRTETMPATATFIVSSDEEPGNTVRDVQAFLASHIAGAPRPMPRAAPLVIPHWLRRLRTIRSNAPDVVYSSRRLRQNGFHFPFGLAEGLRDAIRLARG